MLGPDQRFPKSAAKSLLVIWKGFAVRCGHGRTFHSTCQQSGWTLAVVSLLPQPEDRRVFVHWTLFLQLCLCLFLSWLLVSAFHYLRWRLAVHYFWRPPHFAGSDPKTTLHAAWDRSSHRLRSGNGRSTFAESTVHCTTWLRPSPRAASSQQ